MLNKQPIFAEVQNNDTLYLWSLMTPMSIELFDQYWQEANIISHREESMFKFPSSYHEWDCLPEENAKCFGLKTIFTHE